MADVTQILAKIEQGDEHATEQLLPLVYAELRSLAAARMANERSDHTLQPTGLVHEAYLRLRVKRFTQQPAGGVRPSVLEDRDRFLAEVVLDRRA